VIRLGLLAALLASAAGCSDMTRFETALQNDKAPVCAKITTIYGSAQIDRYFGCEPVPQSCSVAPAKASP
jgi:hypothetical protein